jgi:tRNA dimethylallyltransferase
MSAPVLAIVGPTASGKSALALDLIHALAQQHPAEIISMDSAQVFCDMDIGTAKPSADERAAVPHHLLDIIDPTEAYSAARFCSETKRLIDDIHARGKLPVIVGGTLLYLKALREGLADLPHADPAVRAQIDADAQAHGWPALHAELAAHDPITAARLAPNDQQRIQRALEILRSTGTPMSTWLARQTPTAPPAWPFIGVALQPADMAGRAVLHERIAQRFDAMLGAGLVDEVHALRERYTLSATMTSMRCVGYRQAWQYIDGEITAATLRDTGIYATRQLAKRQITWLRSLPRLHNFDCLDPALTSTVQAWLAPQLAGTH